MLVPLRSAVACAQVKLDDLLEHAEAFIKALRAGKEFIADTKPFQASPAQPAPAPSQDWAGSPL